MGGNGKGRAARGVWSASGSCDESVAAVGMTAWWWQTELGRAQLLVSIRREQLQGTPIDVWVVPGPTHAAKCRVVDTEQLRATPGHQMRVLVELRDSCGNLISKPVQSKFVVTHHPSGEVVGSSEIIEGIGLVALFTIPLHQSTKTQLRVVGDPELQCHTHTQATARRLVCSA